jgi:nicotinate-nucleotide pyrophosphorylase (carboxylating)
VRIDWRAQDGDTVEANQILCVVYGPARVLLTGERSALNFVMVLSGIASEARRWQKAAGDRLSVTDTRKTLPGLRELSKYAVRVGGARNHRSGLYDMVLIKDNHVAHAGGVTDAVLAVKRAHPEMLVECEADTIAQAAEAAAAGADYVLLDNMDDATLRDAVAAVHEAAGDRVCLTEASGGITFERLAGLATTGVDRVSTSALTLARPLDFGLDARG